MGLASVLPAKLHERLPVGDAVSLTSLLASVCELVYGVAAVTVFDLPLRQLHVGLAVGDVRWTDEVGQ